MAAVLLMALAAAGCAQHFYPAGGAPLACLLPAQRPMLVAQLFFGRDVAGRAPVSEAEWSDFAAQEIARQFPDGFTVYDGEGAWRDPQTQLMSREPTKILLVAVDPSADLAGRIGAVIEAYRNRFAQESVGLVTGMSCVAF